MNKADLLKKIDDKFVKKSLTKDITNEDEAAVGLKHYRVYVWDVEGDVMKSTSVDFFAEGKNVTSNSFWANNEPKKVKVQVATVEPKTTTTVI